MSFKKQDTSPLFFFKFDYLTNVNFEEPNRWHPFYNGKSEKLSDRINEHCFQDFDKTTYGLKLKHRSSLLENVKIRFSYFTVTQDKTLDKMTNLEREIRNEINLELVNNKNEMKKNNTWRTCCYNNFDIFYNFL